jgi:hypothetical protein
MATALLMTPLLGSSFVITAPLTVLTEDVVVMVLEVAKAVPPFWLTNGGRNFLDWIALFPPLSPLALLLLLLLLRNEFCK